MVKQFMIYGAPVGLTSIAMALFSSMGGLLFGYDTGQIADITPMEDFKNRFAQTNAEGEREFSHVRSGLIVGILSIGTLVGALCGASISDLFGRRHAMSLAATVIAIGIVIQMATFHAWEQFMMGRFVAGLGVGALSANVPIYQSEIAPKQIRGTLVATYQLFITIGILLAYCFGIGTRKIDGPGSWRTLIGLGLFFCTILGVGIQFMPESPRWLMQRDRHEDARRSLARVRGTTVEAHDPYVDHDYNEIYEAIQLEHKIGKGTWPETFGPRLRMRTILGMLLQMFQQLTGANYFFYYGATIFAGVGISDSYVTQIILGAVNVVTTFPGLWFLERFGRRKTLFWGALWQSAWLFGFAIAGTVKDPAENKGVGQFMIVAACFFIAGFASTWGPGIWVVTGEMYPTRGRQKMQALSVASNWLWNFLLAFFTPFITGDIGYRYGFVFAGCNFAGAALIFFFIKEGHGLSLEQLETLWEDHSTPAWRSAEWVPPGYAHRTDAVEANVGEKKGLRNLGEESHHDAHIEGHHDEARQVPV